MPVIYEPKGKAREYSPLALNLYEGCDHNCFYCYVPNIKKAFNKNYNHEIVNCRKNVIENLRVEAPKLREKNQVLLSFTGDPYCQANTKYGLTRLALEILYQNNIQVAILTKGGKRATQDIEIIKKFDNSIKVGCTLTFDNDNHSLEYEPGAAPITERIEMLKYFYEHGIETWVSMEPVLNHKQSLNCIEMSMPYTSHFKIGKLNHYPEIEKKIEWTQFLHDVVEIMRVNNKPFYIKHDLLKWNDDIVFEPHEIDQDYLNVKPFKVKELELFA